MYMYIYCMVLYLDKVLYLRDGEQSSGCFHLQEIQGQGKPKVLPEHLWQVSSGAHTLSSKEEQLNQERGHHSTAAHIR